MDCFWLAALVVATRFLFRSRFLYDIDSVNFALALERFDPTLHQPHPPGYFLYVWLGRLVFAVVRDANAALVTISVLSSCGAAIMIYALTDGWFGRRAAIGAGLIFLFSPLCWFHGTVALTYIVEAFFAAMVGYLCWMGYSGRPAFLLLAAAALGLGAGFRQSSLLLLGPLWLFSLRRAGLKTAIAGFLVLSASIFAWFVPMMVSVGGPRKYFAALHALWSLVPGRQNLITSALGFSIARIATVTGILFLCFGAALVLAAGRGADAPDRKLRAFTWVWIAPGLAFFSLVFLKFVNSGYLLLITPPLFAWLGRQAAAWFHLRRVAVATGLAAANVAIYLFAPLYCSYRSVREFEAELVEVQQSLRRLASPEATLLVGFDSHFLGYRHAGYYLPEYLTLQFPEVTWTSGKRVFSLRNRATTLLDRLSIDGFQRFVLVPLPRGEKSYEDYMSNVTRRFPDGALRLEVIEGREFRSGSIADLPLLFPSCAPSYTPIR